MELKDNNKREKEEEIDETSLEETADQNYEKFQKIISKDPKKETKIEDGGLDGTVFIGGRIINWWM